MDSNTQNKDKAQQTPEKSAAVRPHHRMRPISQKAPHQQLRQWLNIIFMLGAVIGLVVYFCSETKQTGIIIILAAMVFKFVEVALRIMK